VAWSHGSRFDLAQRLAGSDPRGQLLDYGCGDVTFVEMVHTRFAEVRGVDVEPEQIEGCRRRLGDLPGVSFALTRDTQAADAHAWSVVTCMEVLEHCLEDERRRVIGELARLCRPGGRIVISVPIETGPSLLGKQLVRAVAALRGLGDYAHRERYTPFEMMRSVAGLAVTRVSYTGEGSNGPFDYYGHKGFDWRDVQREIGERMTIQQRMFSPLSWTGSLANSQAWFICTPRA